MTYRIEGLDPAAFAPLFNLSDEELVAHGVLRVTANADFGFPCRISLEDARAGESLLMLHHTSHDVTTPYRSSYAIFVREGAKRAARYKDQIPPLFKARPLGLRAFRSDGMLKTASLALSGQAEEKIRELLDDPAVSYIDAHNAAHGCFAARIERG